MKLAPCHGYLPETSGPDEIVASLAELGHFRQEPPVTLLRTYYDTFDWRLHGAGGSLIEEQDATGVRSCWRRSADGRLLAQASCAVLGDPRQLPPGALRETLAGMTEMRALLPVARLQLRICRAALLDKLGKTVLRLVFEEGRAATASGHPGQSLPPRLCLEPVKGYPEPFARACRLLDERFGLEAAPPQLDELLALAGRRPGDYSCKLEIELQTDMPAGEALRKILRQLLVTMQRNLEGTRKDLDSEFLHDFRVAVRRTRSLFSQLRGVLPPTETERFRAGFKWLGQITGETRDLDVYLLKLPGYRDGLPQSMQADLQPLHDYLAREQKKSQRKLARQLASARSRSLLDAWGEFLEAPWQTPPWPEKASVPIVQIANRRIWKTYRLVLREGLAIGEDSPAVALHELRISCKKLRYLLEFFQSLYPQKTLRRQLKLLKSLQDNLGDFHDLEVQANELRRFGRAMQEENTGLPGETFMAMGVLIDSLYQRQKMERRNFAKRFARFAQEENRQTCRELFNPSLKD